jgi:hypothetical protein
MRLPPDTAPCWLNVLLFGLYTAQQFVLRESQTETPAHVRRMPQRTLGPPVGPALVQQLGLLGSR